MHVNCSNHNQQCLGRAGRKKGSERGSTVKYSELKLTKATISRIENCWSSKQKTKLNGEEGVDDDDHDDGGDSNK